MFSTSRVFRGEQTNPSCDRKHDDTPQHVAEASLQCQRQCKTADGTSAYTLADNHGLIPGITLL